MSLTLQCVFTGQSLIRQCFSASFPANWTPPCRSRRLIAICMCVWLCVTTTNSEPDLLDHSTAGGVESARWGHSTGVGTRLPSGRANREQCQSLTTSDSIEALQIGFGFAAASPHWEHIVFACHVFLINWRSFGRLGRNRAKQVWWCTDLGSVSSTQILTWVYYSCVTAESDQQVAGSTHCKQSHTHLQLATDVGSVVDL